MSTHRPRTSPPRASVSGSTTCPGNASTPATSPTLIEDPQRPGVTTNPSIFQAALGGASDDSYRGRRSPSSRGAAPMSTTRSSDSRPTTSVTPPTSSARSSTPPAASTAGSRSRSSPDLAHDTEATVAEATELWASVDRPNALIKIPATKAASPRSPRVIGAGISVNVTLIFSLERYAERHRRLPRRPRAREGRRHRPLDDPLRRVVLRLPRRHRGRQALSAYESGTAEALKSKAGVANARLAYEVFEKTFAAPRAQELVAVGANVQRPLWASTGVKNPRLPDTLYVTELVAPGTVNTMPEKTLEATFDHGVITGDTITGGYEDARLVFAQLAELGVDIADVTQLLEDEGVAKFIASWQDLKQTVATALADAPEIAR